jgi:hypothetical protein
MGEPVPEAVLPTNRFEHPVTRTVWLHRMVAAMSSNRYERKVAPSSSVTQFIIMSSQQSTTALESLVAMGFGEDESNAVRPPSPTFPALPRVLGFGKE